MQEYRPASPATQVLRLAVRACCHTSSLEHHVVGTVGQELDQAMPRGLVVPREGHQATAAVEVVRLGVVAHLD